MTKKNEIKIKLPSNKIFGLFFSLVFLLIGFYFFEKKEIFYFFSSISVVFFILSFLRPEKLKLLNFLWIKLGLSLGAIIAPVVMAIIYYILITPISILMRIFGGDPLKLKIKKKDSFWIKRKDKINTMKDLY